MKRYCGDCCFLRLERDKNEQVTGLYICVVWKGYRSVWQDLPEHCSSFKDKEDIEEEK